MVLLVTVHYSGMHLDKIQSLNYKPCRGEVSPPSIVFHPTENRYSFFNISDRFFFCFSLTNRFEDTSWLIYLKIAVDTQFIKVGYLQIVVEKSGIVKN